MADDVPRIDRPILEAIHDRLRTAPQFARAAVETTEGQLRLEARFAHRSNPTELTERSLDVRWYTNDDFRIHYREVWPDSAWEMRWDRHPNPHNDRDHFHPPPKAATPGTDREWPADYRDVLGLVLADVRDRSEQLWGGSTWSPALDRVDRHRSPTSLAARSTSAGSFTLTRSPS